MKRPTLAAAIVAATLLVPAAAMAQSPAPAASPALIGVDTFDVCLAIRGPVIQLTPESLTQGISDGTFVIEGLSDDCEPASMASPAATAAP